MGRFYLYGLVRTDNMAGCLVCDREDYIVEFLSINIIKHLIREGVEIEGIYVADGRINFNIAPMSKDLYKTAYHNETKMMLSGMYNYNKSIGVLEITPPKNTPIKYCDCGMVSNIVKIRYNLNMITGGKKLPSLWLNCYCEDSKGRKTHIEDVSSSEMAFPIVDELRYKLSCCSSDEEFKNIILKYYGGVKNLIKLSVEMGAFYFAAGNLYNLVGRFDDSCVSYCKLLGDIIYGDVAYGEV